MKRILVSMINANAICLFEISLISLTKIKVFWKKFFDYPCLLLMKSIFVLYGPVRLFSMVFCFIYIYIFLEDISPFCGAAYTPILDFW